MPSELDNLLIRFKNTIDKALQVYYDVYGKIEMQKKGSKSA